MFGKSSKNLPQNQQFSPTNYPGVNYQYPTQQMQNNPYYIAPKDSFKVTTKRTKFIEFLMIVTPIIIASVLFTITFDLHTKDNRKNAAINQVINALRLFYQNSSNVELSRAYPIALSSELNEVDYEYTLQKHLTGLTLLDIHAYIQPQDFPKDPWGIYSKDFTNRPALYNRLEKLPIPTTQNVYSEGFDSCNFNKSNEKYIRCYLYTSSSSGDSFKLAYYSEVKQGLIVHTETRNLSKEAQKKFIPLKFK